MVLSNNHELAGVGGVPTMNKASGEDGVSMWAVGSRAWPGDALI